MNAVPIKTRLSVLIAETNSRASVTVCCVLVYLCLPGYAQRAQTVTRESESLEAHRLAGHRVLKVFNRDNSPFGKYGLSAGVVFQDSTGRLWVGSGPSADQVVKMYDEKTDQWTVF